MASDPVSRHDILKGCTILIVEDDKKLSKRIAQIFLEHTETAPIIVDNQSDAQKCIIASHNQIALAVMDIMLPVTIQSVRQIRKLEKTIEQAKATINKQGNIKGIDNLHPELSDARIIRSQALKQINQLIDLEGGINLLERLRIQLNGSGICFPILFLTSIGNDQLIRRGTVLTGDKSDWIIKPAPSELILEKSLNLIHTYSSFGKGQSDGKNTK